MLLLPDVLRERILRSARAAAPAEACGLLGGRAEGERRVVVVERVCRNVAPEPRWAYRADAQDQLDAMLDFEDAGLEMLGVWHSHPAGPPMPSPADAAEARWPGLSHVVAWLAPMEGLGSWVWRPPRFEPEPLFPEAGDNR